MCEHCSTSTQAEIENEEYVERILPTDDSEYEEEDEELPICPECNDPTEQSELDEYNGMCESCREDYVECEDCHDLVYNDATHAVYRSERRWNNLRNEERVVCRDCYHEGYLRCADCGRSYNSDMTEINGQDICHSCRDDSYYMCDNCETWLHGNDTHTDSNDEGCYCEDCIPASTRQSELIRGYSYKPNPNFHYLSTEFDNQEFFGWELEVDDGDLSDNTIIPLNDVIGDYVYFKEDGSLDSGFEMVSHPATFAYHMSRKNDFEQAFKHLVRNNFRSDQTDTCGLHVHISRTAFGDDENKRMFNMSRLMYLVEIFHDQVYKMSRRTASSMSRWAQRYGLEPTDIPEDMLKKANGGYYSSKSRYYILNFENSNTVEIRAFRGSLKTNTFIATLQFVKTLVDVSVSNRDLTQFTWDNFKKFVKAKQHQELLDYIVEREL